MLITEAPSLTAFWMPPPNSNAYESVSYLYNMAPRPDHRHRRRQHRPFTKPSAVTTPVPCHERPPKKLLPVVGAPPPPPRSTKARGQ